MIRSLHSLSLIFLISKLPRLASSQHPFPNFGLRAPPAFTQIAEQVAVDHNPNIGVHVCDLEYALKKGLTIGRRHPTVQGHSVLGEARDYCRCSRLGRWHT